MKKLIKVFLCFTLFVSSVFCLTSYEKNENGNLIREVNIDEKSLDNEAIFNTFDSYSIDRVDDSVIVFNGIKTLKKDNFSELDNCDSSQMQENSFDNAEVKYCFSYDVDTNIVSISAEMKNDLGEIEIDDISGVGFINENGDIDAVMNIDDTSVLLSEMKEVGLIQNCGWFKSLIKAIVVTATVVAVTAAAAAIVVATAGAVAPALVAAGVGVAGSTAVTATATAIGLGAACLFTTTIGSAAIKAGTAVGDYIGEGIESIIDKRTGVVLALIIVGVEYAVEKVRANVASKTVESGQYKFVLFTAAVPDFCFMTIKTFERTKAVWGLRLGLNTYSSADDALIAAQDASGKSVCKHHTREEDAWNSSYGAYKNGVHFNHYHAYTSQPSLNAIGEEIKAGHACYGTPLIVINGLVI